MTAEEAERWFGEYLDRFAAVGRGAIEDPSVLLRFYGAPLLVTSDGGAGWFADEEALHALVRGQAEAMRSSGYDASEVLSLDITVLNATSVLVRGSFVRRRADGSEIARLGATYLIADGPGGRRIAAIALQAA